MARLPEGVTVVRQELRPGFLDVTLAVGPRVEALEAPVRAPDDQEPARILCSAHSPVRHGRGSHVAGPVLETTDANEAVAFFLRNFRNYRNCCIAVLDTPVDTRCQSSVTGPRSCAANGCRDCQAAVAEMDRR